MERESEDYIISCGLFIPKQFGNRLKETVITTEKVQVQKKVLLGMDRILRKILEI